MPTTNISWQNLTNATINGSGDLEKTTDTLGGTGCMTNASGTGDAGARSVETITAGDFEFRCTLGPIGGQSGRTFVGLDHTTFTLDFSQWDFCLHVSTELNTTGTPHPVDSIFVYEGSPPNKTYLDGVWNEGDLLRFVYTNGVMRYYQNSRLIYTSSLAVTYPVFAVVSFACLNKTIIDPQFITSGGAAACEEGVSTGDSCSASWTMPTVAAFPVPAIGGPIPTSFSEVDGEWGEFGSAFPDGRPNFNTIKTAATRKFEVDYLNLSPAEAALLDAHYDSTRGGLKFTLQNPNTMESITGVRYEDYTAPTHTKIWALNRSIKFVKYAN